MWSCGWHSNQFLEKGNDVNLINLLQHCPVIVKGWKLNCIQLNTFWITIGKNRLSILLIKFLQENGTSHLHWSLLIFLLLIRSSLSYSTESFYYFPLYSIDFLINLWICFFFLSISSFIMTYNFTCLKILACFWAFFFF